MNERIQKTLVHFEKTEHGIILTLPNEVANHPAFASGESVHIAAKYSSLVITHPDAKRYNVEEMVATITPENMHGEIDWGPPVGKEIW